MHAYEYVVYVTYILLSYYVYVLRVSIDGGIPKWMVYNRTSYWNRWFWGYTHDLGNLHKFTGHGLCTQLLFLGIEQNVGLVLNVCESKTPRETRWRKSWIQKALTSHWFQKVSRSFLRNFNPYQPIPMNSFYKEHGVRRAFNSPRLRPSSHWAPTPWHARLQGKRRSLGLTDLSTSEMIHWQKMVLDCSCHRICTYVYIYI